MEQIYPSGTKPQSFEYSQHIALQEESASLPLTSWKFRPLVPLAAFAVTGCSIGLSWLEMHQFAVFTRNILSGNSWQILAALLIFVFLLQMRKASQALLT